VAYDSCTAVGVRVRSTRMSTSLLGLRTVVYRAPDLLKARDWYTAAFGVTPYFDQPFYVGFSIGGFELGLDPNAPARGDGSSTMYWGVPSLDLALASLLAAGATLHEPARDVGEHIRVGAVKDPFGNVLGLIENPGFVLPSKT
jgi:predicted enzyme related to lactoylglutathione lyase